MYEERKKGCCRKYEEWFPEGWSQIILAAQSQWKGSFLGTCFERIMHRYFAECLALAVSWKRGHVGSTKTPRASRFSSRTLLASKITHQPCIKRSWKPELIVPRLYPPRSVIMSRNSAGYTNTEESFAYWNGFFFNFPTILVFPARNALGTYEYYLLIVFASFEQRELPVFHGELKCRGVSHLKTRTTQAWASDK